MKLQFSEEDYSFTSSGHSSHACSLAISCRHCLGPSVEVSAGRIYPIAPRHTFTVSSLRRSSAPSIHLFSVLISQQSHQPPPPPASGLHGEIYLAAGQGDASRLQTLPAESKR